MVCGISIFYEKEVLTLGACLSIFSHLVVFFLFYYVNIPNLRRHPTTIIIRKCWFELIFVSQYLWIAFVPNSFFWKAGYSDTDDDNNCNAQPHLWPLAWLTQFSLLGGELWFGMLSVDIHAALTNPFSSYAMNDRYYTFIVYFMAILTATVLVSMNPIQYGLSSDPMIWVKDKSIHTNWTKVGMFYIYLPFIYIYCGLIALWARWQIHRGLEETLKVRKYSVSKQTRYVIGYFIFWTIVYVFQFTVYVNEDFAGTSSITHLETTFKTISAFFLASRGTWSLGLFIIANWQDLSAFFQQENKQKDANAPPKQEEELVQLNIALQKEIVRFTALGIQRAVRDSEYLSRNSKSRISSLSIPFNLFKTKFTGDAVSFVVDDDEYLKSKSADLNEPVLIEEGVRGSIPLSVTSMNSSRSQNSQDVDISPIHKTRESAGYDDSVDSRESNLPTAPLPGSNITVDRMSSMTSSTRDSFSNKIIQHLDRLKQRIISPRGSFRFTDFSPKIFAKIRHLSGINVESYLDSFKNTTMPSFSEGKSGAFVYFSSDYKYIVKTTTPYEFEKLLSILPAYGEYLEKEYSEGHESLITRFLGAHRIIMYDIPLYFVVMKNVCPLVDEKYDLKGSWVNRHGSKKNKDPQASRPKKNFSVLASGYVERTSVDAKPSTPLFLDNDLQNSFLLHPDDANRLACQIDRDIRFLQQFNLMDYSLLVGVRRKTFMVNSRSNSKDSNAGGVSLIDKLRSPFSKNPDENGLEVAVNISTHSQHNIALSLKTENEDDLRAIHAAAVEGAGTFYFGIIDILQEWNWSKWNERMFKIWFLRKDGAGLSAIEPVSYRKRFMKRAVVDIFSGLDNFTINEEDGEDLQD